MNISDKYPFILPRYISGGSNRFTCPGCGGKKSFTRYMNVDTGEYVSDECGICNHRNSCGYHYPPRDYYRDHPNDRNGIDEEPFCINGIRTVLKQKPIRHIETIDSDPQTDFYSLTWAKIAAQRDCTFKYWFNSLPFDEQTKQDVLNQYYVGGTQKDTYVNGINYGKAVVFWIIDELQRVHDAKLIAYTSDGHRVQGWGNSMRSICVSMRIGPQLEHTDKVLFGQHLLTRYPDKTICVVESEKSALVCSCHYPEYVWLATGGCGNLQKEKIKPLMNRKVVIFPDSGEYDYWVKCMEDSGHKNYYVVNFMEQFEPNTDIADVILGEAKQNVVL